jgi:hypothetical protein
MSAKTTPESQFRALLVRDAIAVIGIEYPTTEDDRFRDSIVARVIEEAKDLEPSQLTRLHEAASAADAKHSGIPELRHALRCQLGRRYDLAGARRRAKTSPPATT